MLLALKLKLFALNSEFVVVVFTAPLLLLLNISVLVFLSSLLVIVAD